MGKYDAEIAEAIEKLIPTRQVPVPSMDGKKTIWQSVKTADEPAPYIAFQWETGYVVMLQSKFNKLTPTQKNKLMAPVLKKEAGTNGRTKKRTVKSNR